MDHFVIAVRNHYWHISGGRPISTRDFHIVTTELDARRLVVQPKA
ncbi:MAG TPA: hypothetical protein VGH53_07965 [Streptosporangiaceae bacterium]